MGYVGRGYERGLSLTKIPNTILILLEIRRKKEMKIFMGGRVRQSKRDEKKG